MSQILISIKFSQALAALPHRSAESLWLSGQAPLFLGGLRPGCGQGIALPANNHVTTRKGEAFPHWSGGRAARSRTRGL